MSLSFHLSVNIKGVLKLSPRDFHKQWGGVFEDDNGRTLSDDEARDRLMDELQLGHRVIPCGDCDNFDYAGLGCRGHIQKLVID